MRFRRFGRKFIFGQPNREPISSTIEPEWDDIENATQDAIEDARRTTENGVWVTAPLE